LSVVRDAVGNDGRERVAVFETIPFAAEIVEDGRGADRRAGLIVVNRKSLLKSVGVLVIEVIDLLSEGS
jgi:hypothetical protein